VDEHPGAVRRRARGRCLQSAIARRRRDDRTRLPGRHDDQVLADLSVKHSGTLDHYRAAEEISQRAAAGTASTEDLRQAMVHYRALFGDLLGEPADTGSESAAAADTSEQLPESDPKEMAK
jgi:hypothetical protein